MVYEFGLTRGTEAIGGCVCLYTSTSFAPGWPKKAAGLAVRP